VTRSGETLSEIVMAVKQVTDIIAEIAAASAEQTSGIDQVNKAVAQMDQVVQSNSGQTEELSSTAQSLAAQAVGLQALVGRFKLGDHTAGPRAVSAATRAKSAVPSAVKPAAKSGPVVVKPGKAEPALVVAHAGNGHGHGARDGFEEF
jgi:hypothetical protein